MSGRAWTPGPWSAVPTWDRGGMRDGCLIIGPDGTTIAVLHIPTGPGMRRREEVDACASLIAAAPELFDTVEYMADLFRDACRDPSTDTGWRTDEQLEVWERARAALRAATGSETP